MFVHALLTLALAATVIPQTPEQLTDRSTTVVRARVVSQRAAREPGPAGIYTRTTLRVEAALKGKAPATLVVRQAGGRLGSERVRLLGDAALKEGEEVLVFLTCRPGADHCALVGLAQGAFELIPDGAGGRLARRDFRDTTFVKGAPLTGQAQPYAALAEKIRAHVKAHP